MLFILLAAAFALLVLIVWMLSLDAEFTVRQNVAMHADVETVFNIVRDLRTWPNWHPLLVHEPTAQITYSKSPARERGYYHWNGKLIGTGKCTHVDLHQSRSIEQRLDFFRPFRSLAVVRWEFRDATDGIEVVWDIRMRLPFLLRPIVPLMRQTTVKDFALGLTMLRERYEPGAKGFSISFHDECELPPFDALVEQFRGDKQLLRRPIHSDFEQIEKYLATRGVAATGTRLCAYEQVDIDTDCVQGVRGIPVAADVDPGDYDRRRFAGGRYFRIDYRGRLELRDQVWHCVYRHLSLSSRKWDKSREALEVYESEVEADSSATRAKLTSIYVPIS